MDGNALTCGDALSGGCPVIQRNLVYNHDFRYFSNSGHGKVNVPDGWTYADPGPNGSIGPAPSGAALLVVTSNDSSSTMQLQQALHEFPRWHETLNGRRVSGRVHLSMPANCRVTATLSDGISSNSVTWESAEGGAHVFAVGLDVNEDASGLHLSLESRSNAMEITISQIYANIGSVALDGLECMVRGVIGEVKQYIATEQAPAGELGLCEPARELTADESRLDSVLAGRFGVGTNGRSLLPDMRGYFVRAWDNGAQVDPDAVSRSHLGTGTEPSGDHVGTEQSDEFASHFHNVFYQPALGGTDGAALNQLATQKTALKAGTENSGGKETRSKNLYLLYTMKWA